MNELDLAARRRLERNGNLVMGVADFVTTTLLILAIYYWGADLAIWRRLLDEFSGTLNDNSAEESRHPRRASGDAADLRRMTEENSRLRKQAEDLESSKEPRLTPLRISVVLFRECVDNLIGIDPTTASALHLKIDAAVPQEGAQRESALRATWSRALANVGPEGVLEPDRRLPNRFADVVVRPWLETGSEHDQKCMVEVPHGGTYGPYTLTQITNGAVLRVAMEEMDLSDSDARDALSGGNDE
jgi:hypothetical protein